MTRSIGYWSRIGLLCALAVAPAEAQRRCNGETFLCDRTYDQVVHATTHNAYSTAADGYTVPLPNQELDMPTQLADGIRALMLDTHDKGGTPYLCHGVCGFLLGQRPLVDGLVEIREFLDTRPDEVVTIIFEAYVTEAATEAAFVEAGLTPYLYHHTAGDPWPTLGEMIDAGERLVVLTDDSEASLDWHLYVWDVAWETPFSFDDLGEFTCTENRGTPPADLFILNHFVTGLLGAVRFDADEINAYELLHNRAVECWGYEASNVAAHVPNFVTVDHYDIGATLDVVSALNRQWPRVPLWHEHGSSWVRGETVELRVQGAEPGETVVFVAGTAGQGPGPCLPQLGGQCLDLVPPIRLLGQVDADATGVATLELDVPVGLSGSVATQAGIVRGPDGEESIKSIAVGATVVDP